MIGCYEEPYESRGSRTVLRGAGGEIPLLSQRAADFSFISIISHYDYFIATI
jgi:hypothetical protein